MGIGAQQLGQFRRYCIMTGCVLLGLRGRLGRAALLIARGVRAQNVFLQPLRPVASLFTFTYPTPRTPVLMLSM
jgi:hypothetical protein